MNEHNADRNLKLLVGELLYKNQLLRDAVASKDQTIDLIINQLMTEAVSACSCGVGSQLISVRDAVKSQDIEFAKRRNCWFGGSGDVVLRGSGDFLSVSPSKEIGPVEK